MKTTATVLTFVCGVGVLIAEAFSAHRAIWTPQFFSIETAAVFVGTALMLVGLVRLVR